MIIPLLLASYQQTFG